MAIWSAVLANSSIVAVISMTDAACSDEPEDNWVDVSLTEFAVPAISIETV